MQSKYFTKIIFSRYYLVNPILLCYTDEKGGNDMKKAHLLLIVGVIFLLVGLIQPIIAMANADIIGGAGFHTFSYYLRVSKWLYLTFLTIGVPLMVSGLVWLLFPGFLSRHCPADTTLISLGLSACGGVGIYSFLTWLFLTALYSVDRYPIRYPLTMVLSLISFLCFVYLIFLYIRRRSLRLSWAGIGLDVGRSILYLPAFYMLLGFFESLHP